MSLSLEDVCRQLELTDAECEMLEKWLPDLCPPCAAVEEKKRKRSRWQQCIASRRKGKGFDPSAIKQLAKEYKQGKCPP
jgi:hypothetical protein